MMQDALLTLTGRPKRDKKRGVWVINVFLVDDHELVRTGIRRILEDVRGIKVVGEVQSGELAVTFCRQHHPDVILIIRVADALSVTAALRWHAATWLAFWCLRYKDRRGRVWPPPQQGLARPRNHTFSSRNSRSQRLITPK